MTASICQLDLKLNLKVYGTTMHDDGSNQSTQLFMNHMASLTHLSVMMNIIHICLYLTLLSKDYNDLKMKENKLEAGEGPGAA